MRIDIKDLPLNLQEQALRKLAEEEQRQSGAALRYGLKGKGIELHINEKRSEGDAKCVTVLQANGNEENSAVRALDSVVGDCDGVKKNKYRARKVTLPLPDGTDHTFDSKHEAEVYGDLWLQLQAGEISDLKIQVPFELLKKQLLTSGKHERPVVYIADFTYIKDGELHVVDAKGYKKSTAYSVFVIKRKLMKYIYDIEVEEV